MSLLHSLEMQGIGGWVVHPHLNIFLLFAFFFKQKYYLIWVQIIYLCPYIFAMRLDKQSTLLRSPISVSTPLDELILVKYVYLDCVAMSRSHKLITLVSNTTHKIV